MVSINEPNTWKHLASYGSGWFTPEDTAQHVIGLGANGTYCGIYVDYWNNNAMMNNGLTQSQHAVRFLREIRRLGGITHLQVIPWDWGAGGTPATPYQNAVVNNIGGAQDTYIQWVKNTLTIAPPNNPSLVSSGIPDVLQIMNEVEGDAQYGTATDAWWDKYVSFCNRYMTEMANIKPNLIFSISGVPFWNLTKIATKTFNIPAGCKLFYDYHYYYSFYGEVPTSDYPEQVAYWNSDFALGKQLTYDKWYLGQNWDGGQGGMKALLDQGKTILFDEQGVNINNPNYAVWMKDAIDFCIAHKIGFAYLDHTGNCTLAGNADIRLPYNDQATCEANGGYWHFNHSPAAFWSDSTWTLNPIGQTWKQIIDSVKPPLTLPYNDSFANLDNWTKINGVWNPA